MPGLGRKPSTLDIRDYKLSAYVPRKLDVSGARAWSFLSNPLDQGETNHCVGFAIADFGINLPVQTPCTDVDAHAFYYACKVQDGEPGGEDGTSIRSAAKVLKQRGMVTTYAFAFSVDEISYWLLNHGPLIVGTLWTADMFTPNKDNIIRPTGNVSGGHGYLLNEKTQDGYYFIQNSWDGWGRNGGAYISIDDFAILFRNGGEAIAAVEVPSTGAPVKSKGCLADLVDIFFKVKE